MFNMFFISVLILAIVQIIKEAFEKPTPKGTRFDWEAYWKDVESGMPAMEQVRKRQRGGYMTTKQLPDNTIPENKIVDVKRYEHDKREYGEEIAEINRQNGSYTYIRKV